MFEVRNVFFMHIIFLLKFLLIYVKDIKRYKEICLYFFNFFLSFFSFFIIQKFVYFFYLSERNINRNSDSIYLFISHDLNTLL